MISFFTVCFLYVFLTTSPGSGPREVAVLASWRRYPSRIPSKPSKTSVHRLRSTRPESHTGSGAS